MPPPSNRSPEAPVYRRGGKGKLPPLSLRISRDGERLAGLEEGLEAAQDLGPAFLHGLEGRAAPGELVVRDGELAHQSHGFDLVGHARRLVLRSEERRVGKGGRSWLASDHELHV